MIQPCQCLEFFRCVWFNSRYAGLNQPPILASIADLDTSANIWELGARRIRQIQCTCCVINHNNERASRIYILTADMSSRHFPGTRRIASYSPSGTFSMHASNCILLTKRYFLQARLQMHPPRPHVILLPYCPVILLNFVLYLPLYTSVYIPQLHFIQHGTYGQPGEESLFTEESRRTP